jgi:hypothetical protein
MAKASRYGDVCQAIDRRQFFDVAGTRQAPGEQQQKTVLVMCHAEMQLQMVNTGNSIIASFREVQPAQQEATSRGKQEPKAYEGASKQYSSSGSRTQAATAPRRCAAARTRYARVPHGRAGPTTDTTPRYNRHKANAGWYGTMFSKEEGKRAPLRLQNKERVRHVQISPRLAQ